MSKNLTRKGLAFGALVALGASVFAGTPAQAANPELVTLLPSAGAEYNTLSHSKFTLSAGFDSSISSSTYTALRYRVINDDLAPITFEVKRGTTAGANTAHKYNTADGAANKVGYQAAITLTDIVIADGGVGVADTVTLTVPSGNLIEAGQTFKITSATGTADASFGAGAGVTVATIAAELNSTAGHTAIAGTNGTTIVFEVPAATVGAAVATGEITSDTGSVNATNNASTEVTTSADFVVEPQTGTNDATIGSPALLELSTSVNNKDTAVKVQAWVDSNGDNAITDGEVVSAIRTVTFKQVSKLVGSATLVQPLIDDATVVANISITGDLNFQQIDSGDVTVTFAQTTGSGYGGETINAGWYSTGGVYRAVTSTISGGVDLGDVFTAQLKLANGDDGTVDDAEGALSTKTAATSAQAALKDTFRIELADTSGVITTLKADKEVTTANSADYEDDQPGTAEVKLDVTKFTVKGFVGSNAATPVAASGATVQVTANPGSDISAGDGLKVNGSAVTTDTNKTFSVTTDASGNWSFDVETAAIDESDDLAISVVVDGVSSQTLTISFNASDYALYDIADRNATGVRSIKVGETVSITYVMVDQYGLAPKDGAYRVTAVDQDNNRTKAADFAVNAAVVAGKATLAITDNGSGTGYTVVRTAFGKVDEALSSTSGDYVDTKLVIVADSTPAKITLGDLTYGSAQLTDGNSDGDYTGGTTESDVDNRAKLLLETLSFKSYDNRTKAAGETAPTQTAGYNVTVSGTVADAAGVALAGAPVTLKAVGFLFKVGSIYFVDEISLVAGSNGKFSVDVWSQSGGAKSIAITSGAATASQALTYAAGGSSSVATFTVVTGASTVVPGRTVDVTVSAKDKFGNPAAGASLTLKSTGAGYLQALTGTTDSAGNFTTKLISGVQDSGVATITVTATVDGVSTDKVATVAITLAEPSAVVNVVGHRVYVKFNDAKGEEVSAVIGGVRITKTATYSGYVISKLIKKAGKVAVKAYVAGDLVKAATVTVK